MSSIIVVKYSVIEFEDIPSIHPSELTLSMPICLYSIRIKNCFLVQPQATANSMGNCFYFE